MHQPAVMRLLRVCASLRLTPFVILLLAGGIVLSYRVQAPAGWVIAPLLLLALHLLCAILVTPQFRRSTGLLVFHVCLLGVALLAVVGELAHFQGRVELAEGQVFGAGAVDVVRRGPWHPRRALDAIGFTQGQVQVGFAPGLYRQRTRTQVRLPGAGGVRRFGDNEALRVDAYRFYTTSNKGFSASLTWREPARAAVTGVINFPSFPFYDWNQVNTWTAPDGRQVELELHLARPPRGRAWQLDTGFAAGTVLGVRLDGKAVSLKPGEQARFGEASLRFNAVHTWMGYEIYYNPVLAWIFATALVGVLALASHYVLKFARPASLPRRAPETTANGIGRP